jgi:hypothetical protein
MEPFDCMIPRSMVAIQVGFSMNSGYSSDPLIWYASHSSDPNTEAFHMDPWLLSRLDSQSTVGRVLFRSSTKASSLASC